MKPDRFVSNWERREKRRELERKRAAAEFNSVFFGGSYTGPVEPPQRKRKARK